jgi:hypothetical protein
MNRKRLDVHRTNQRENITEEEIEQDKLNNQNCMDKHYERENMTG